MRRIGYVGGQGMKLSASLLVIPVIIGIILGSIFQTAAAPEGSFWVHQYFSPIYSDLGVFAYELYGFAFSALFTAAAFCGGFCAVGQPIGILLLMYRGFGIGASSAFMYSLDGKKAVVGVLILVLPKAVCTVFAAILTVREMLRAANYTLSCWLPDRAGERKPVDIRLYGVKFLVILLILLIISVGDAALALIFGR